MTSDDNYLVFNFVCFNVDLVVILDVVDLVVDLDDVDLDVVDLDVIDC